MQEVSSWIVGTVVVYCVGCEGKREGGGGGALINFFKRGRGLTERGRTYLRWVECEDEVRLSQNQTKYFSRKTLTFTILSQHTVIYNRI